MAAKWMTSDDQELMTCNTKL